MLETRPGSSTYRRSTSVARSAHSPSVILTAWPTWVNTANNTPPSKMMKNVRQNPCASSLAFLSRFTVSARDAGRAVRQSVCARSRRLVDTEANGFLTTTPPLSR